MKEYSENRMEKAKDFEIEKIQQLLQSNFKVRYDQMLLDTSVKRKNVCFVRYQATTLKRTVKIIKFPLYSKIKDQFINEFCGGESVHGPIKKMGRPQLIQDLSGMAGVEIEDYAELNDKRLAFFELPVEFTNGQISNNQPIYFLPSLTYFYPCHSCDGDKYVTCPDSVCQGRHEWTCPTCDGDREITCRECDGRGRNECSDCKGKGEYRCPTCKGTGKRKCPVCDGTRIRESQSVFGGQRDKERCTNCNRDGETICSSKTSSFTVVGKAFKSAFHEYCEGSGIITCSKCDGRGEITCKNCNGRGKNTCPECNGNGTIICHTCYGDSGRYGKVDCETCKTIGELGEMVYVETSIVFHDTESIFTFGESIPQQGFSIDILKKYTQKEYLTSEVYYNVLTANNTENSRENYDSLSIDICNARENALGVKKNQYPKLLSEAIYYEAVPSVTIGYNHILTNTEHEVSFIAIDLLLPEIVFHSNPTEVEVKKLTVFEKIKLYASKAFTTRKYRNKIDKLNEATLLIHLAKADGQISENEKKILLDSLHHLDELQPIEKKEIFNLMAVSSLPQLTEKQCIFSSEIKISEIKQKLQNINDSDGNVNEKERKKLEEIMILMNQAGHFTFSKRLGMFIKSWKISIPILFSILFIAFSIYAFFYILPPIQAKWEHEILIDKDARLSRYLSYLNGSGCLEFSEYEDSIYNVQLVNASGNIQSIEEIGRTRQRVITDRSLILQNNNEQPQIAYLNGTINSLNHSSILIFKSDSGEFRYDEYWKKRKTFYISSFAPLYGKIKIFEDVNKKDTITPVKEIVSNTAYVGQWKGSFGSSILTFVIDSVNETAINGYIIQNENKFLALGQSSETDSSFSLDMTIKNKNGSLGIFKMELSKSSKIIVGTWHPDNGNPSKPFTLQFQTEQNSLPLMSEVLVTNNGTFAVIVGSFKNSIDAENLQKQCKEQYQLPTEILNTNNYEKLTKDLVIVIAGRNLSEDEAMELVKKIKSMSLNCVYKDGGAYNAKGSSAPEVELTKPAEVVKSEKMVEKPKPVVWENLKGGILKYLDGTLYTGPVIKYNKKGVPELEGYFNLGQRSGKWTFYDKEGNIKEVKNY